MCLVPTSCFVCSVPQDNNLTVIILLASTGAAALSNVQVQVSVPPFFNIAGLQGVPAPKPVSADTLSVGNMAAGSATTAFLAVSLALSRTPSRGDVTFRVTYNGAATPQVTGTLAVNEFDCLRCVCSAPVWACTAVALLTACLCCDTTRPSVMQTAQFGQNWGAHAQNVTVNAPAPGVSSPDDFLQVMASHNIHGVDKIAASTWPGPLCFDCTSVA